MIRIIFIILVFYVKSVSAEIQSGLNFRILNVQRSHLAPFSQSNPSQVGLSKMRIRPYISYLPHAELELFLEPQLYSQYNWEFLTENSLSKGWTEQVTELHQGYLDWYLFKDVQLLLGRQELVFADGQVFGDADRSSAGMSFDMLRLNVYHGVNKLSLFYTSYNDEQRLNLLGFGDSQEFYGAYLELKPLSIENIDIYYLNNKSLAVDNTTDIQTIGGRIFVNNSFLPFKIESTFQQQKLTDMQAQQLRLEIDKPIGRANYVLSYLRTSENYNQLFANAYNNLGDIGVLGRANVQDIMFGVRGRIFSSFTYRVSLHEFYRISENALLVNSGGSGEVSQGSANNKDPLVGRELDLSMTYVSGVFTYEAGYGAFQPGAYFETTEKDNELTSYLWMSFIVEI